MNRKKGRKVFEQVAPGEQIIFVISAMPGGFAERVLREIAHPSSNPNNRREFGEWKDGLCGGTVFIEDTGETRELVLRLGVKEGLFLDDESMKYKFSLKHACDGNGTCIIPIAGRSNRTHKEEAKSNTALSVANQVIGSWVIHGRRWRDRAGDTHYWPYGVDHDRKESYDFEVMDGKRVPVPFKVLLEKGGVRSVHPGTWKQSVTIVPAAAGMTVLLHEFEERADGKNDVTSFGDLKISQDGHLWGPYAQWAVNNANGHFGRFQAMAKEAASPFAFHVKATREVFPNVELASAFLLRRMKEKKLLNILTVIAKEDPERFYRLIDETGATWKLTEVTDTDLVFARGEGSRIFSLKDAPENVLGTFKELAAIQENASRPLERKVRLVMDSHFYVVLFGILTQRNGEAHHLGGTDMYRYLMEGSDAHMHRIRNERLFGILRSFFPGIDKLKFWIYPSTALGLPRINQYNFSRESWNVEHWLGKELV